MAHKLQELFHDLGGKICTMNNVVAMPILPYLNKDFNAFGNDDKQKLLKILNEALTKRKNLYKEIVDAEEKLIAELMLANTSPCILDCVKEIMNTIHKTAKNDVALERKLFNYESDISFEKYIKPILEEVMEFDKYMMPIRSKLEEIKDSLREKGLYPKLNI